MSLRIAINGYGRIGRAVLRAIRARSLQQQLQVVAINEPAELAAIVHLSKYDSSYGRASAVIRQQAGGMQMDDDWIAISHHRHLADLNWAAHDVDLVLECSGLHLQADELQQHLTAGARRVLLSAPSVSVESIIYGVNHQDIGNQPILSAASCTTNAIIPVLDALVQHFGVNHASITTLHSLMNDQPVLDGYHNTDLYKTRAAGQSMIPIETGLAAGIGRILPHLQGKLSARALRIPVSNNVSAMQLCVDLVADASAPAINQALAQSAANSYCGVLGYTDEPLASTDFARDGRSGIIDSRQTQHIGSLTSLLVWFDNEWGFANRMLDLSLILNEQRD